MASRRFWLSLLAAFLTAILVYAAIQFADRLGAPRPSPRARLVHLPAACSPPADNVTSRQGRGTQ